MYLIYVDTETFSPQDLSRVGAARYAEDAQIILGATRRTTNQRRFGTA